jgi:hypothetical protein
LGGLPGGENSPPKKKTLNYESKQNIAKKKKKNSGMELAIYQSQIGKVHVVNLVFWQNGLDKQETSIWRNIKIRIVNLAK